MGLKTWLVKNIYARGNLQQLDFAPSNDKKLVVCLTSVPSRFELLRYPIVSILRGRLKPDWIELNLGYLADGSKPQVPAWLAQLQAVKISYQQDIGTMTKFVPSVERHYTDDIRLVVIDDDTYYYPEFLSTLVAAHDKCGHPAVIGYRGELIHKNLCWGYADNSGLEQPGLHRVALTMGCGGFILRPQYLELAQLRANGQLSPLAKKMDDIWISGLLSRQGIPKYKLTTKKPMAKTMDFDSLIISNLQERVEANNEAIKFFAAAWQSEELTSQQDVQTNIDYFYPQELVV